MGNVISIFQQKSVSVSVLNTARRSHSGTISDISSKMRVVRPSENGPKSHDMPLGFSLQTDIY